MANILVIDDDNDITEVVEIYLDESGHKLKCLSSAVEGLEWAKAHKVDLLITDILMPGMTGLELITSFREIQPNSKVLAISGGDSVEIVKDMALETAVEFGAETALSKPFSQDELIDRVSKILKLG